MTETQLAEKADHKAERNRKDDAYCYFSSSIVEEDLSPPAAEIIANTTVKAVITI